MMLLVIILQVVCLFCGHDAERIPWITSECNRDIKVIRNEYHDIPLDDLYETLKLCVNKLNHNNVADISQILHSESNRTRIGRDSTDFVIFDIVDTLLEANKTIFERTPPHFIYTILESIHTFFLDGLIQLPGIIGDESLFVGRNFEYDSEIKYFCNTQSRGACISISNVVRGRNVRISAMFFINDHLFPGSKREVVSRIVNFRCTTNVVPVSIYFNTTEPKEVICGSWMYDSVQLPTRGDWNITAIETIQNGSLIECKTKGNGTIALLKFSLIDDYISSIENNITSTNLNLLSVYLKNESSNINFIHIEQVSHILESAANQNSSMEYEKPFFKTVNTLLGLNKSIFKNVSSDSTDIILQSMDNILMQLSQNRKYTNGSLSKISYEIIHPEASHNNKDYEHSFHGVSIRIPNDVLNTTIITSFENDNLFPNGKVVSQVIDLKIWNVKYNLTSPVSVYFNMTKPSKVMCFFWKYGENGIPGNWSDDGVTTNKIGDLIECKSEHLTAFALLGISDEVISKLSETDQTALQLISTIFCVVSLLGLIVFFATCFALRNWSKKRIFTVHLSCVIALEVFMLFIHDIASIDNGLACVFFGAVMHYLVLVKFTMMLFIAKIQYENFVTVLKSRNKSNHTVWGASISYSIPVIIVGISAGIFSDKYNAGDVKFCYPKEEAFIFFLVVPITIILFVNTFIFALVMFNISNSISRDARQKVLQAKLAIMLFFMLGLSWTFGSVSNVVKPQWLQLMFVYIFIILSPLQGFAIFIFSVVMDSDAKTFWIKSYEKFRYSPLASESSVNTASTGVFMSDVAHNVELNSYSSDNLEGDSVKN